jgi:hypothetical protein
VLRVSLAVMTLLSGILDSPVHGLIIPLLIWLPATLPSEETYATATVPGADTNLGMGWARR